MLISPLTRPIAIMSDCLSTFDERLGLLSFFVLQMSYQHPCMTASSKPPESFKEFLNQIIEELSRYKEELEKSDEGSIDVMLGTNSLIILRDLSTILIDCRQCVGIGAVKTNHLFMDLFTGEKVVKTMVMRQELDFLLLDSFKIIEKMRDVSGLCLPFYCSVAKCFMLSPYIESTLEVLVEKRKLKKREFSLIAHQLLETAKNCHLRVIFVADVSPKNVLVTLNSKGEVAASHCIDFDQWKQAGEEPKLTSHILRIIKWLSKETEGAPFQSSKESYSRLEELESALKK